MPRGLTIDPKEESAIDVTGGVRSNVQPYYLEKNQMYYLQNADLDELGSRRKRYGSTTYGTAGTELGGIGPWVFLNKTRYLGAFWDNDLYLTTGDFSWSKKNDASVSLVTNHLMGSAYGRILEVTASNTTIATTTLFTHSIYASTSDPTLQALCAVNEDGTGTLQASLHPKTIAWWQGRLWLAGCVDSGLGPDSLLWSDILNGIVVDVTRYVEIDPNQGDEIIKILPTRSAKPRLYIFKKHSIHALDVVWTGGAQVPTSENTLDTTNSQVTDLSKKIGAWAPKTVVYASGSGDSDVYFLARDGVRSLRRVEQDTSGGIGDPISEPIKDVIDRINWAVAEKSVAAIYDHKLYMSIPVDGATSNNLTIVYDMTRERWLGEYTIKATDLLVSNFNNQAEKLLGTWDSVTTETVGTATDATAGTHVFWYLNSASYVDPSNTAVEYEEQTRAHYFGHLGQRKRWNWVDIEATPADSTVTFSLYGKVDDRSWVIINTVSIEPAIQYPNLPEPLPWDLAQKDQVRDRQSLMDLPVGRYLQLKLVTDSPAAFGTRTTRVSAFPIEETWE